MLWILLSACFVLDDAVDSPLDPTDTELHTFEVPPGSSARGLGPRLVDAGLIESDTTWQYYLRSRDAGACLKAGRFALARSMDMPELMATLCGPPLVDDEPFTVLEGWRIREIDAALAEKGWIAAGDYATAAGDPSRFRLPIEVSGLANLEGLLFPETYRVVPDEFDAEAFIQRQLDTLGERFVATADFGERAPYDVLIMASMIEREEPDPLKRPLVAGILWKRIDNAWNLGVDATSRYTIDQWNDRKAFLAKLRDPDDPYNTRLRPGLPPTPIGNPGIAALEAAAAPEDSPYWYYLHDSSGVIHPARSAREHEQNRKTWNVY